MNAGLDISRRGLIAATSSALALAATPAAAETEPFETAFDAQSARIRSALGGAKGTKLVLLGTGGGPAPGQARHMTSHLMLHEGAAYVLDCGMGVTDQFARTGTPFNTVRAIFITHHHFDHNVEYGPFLLIGWTRGMGQSVRAYGPPPLTKMTQDFLRAYRATIDFWAEDLKLQPFSMIEVHDLAVMGPVMRDDHVNVTSVLVRHPPVKPAYGYRFDFPDRSIAFSGDTVPLEAVAKLAQGADVLVHEAIDMAAIERRARQMIAEGSKASFESLMHHMRADHSPTEEVGRIAQEGGVKTLVLSHLSPSEAAGGDEMWRIPAARHFKGKIVVGHDLMVV